MRSWPWWVIPWAYAAAEVLCLLSLQTSLFGMLTGFIYGNVQRSHVMSVHIWAAVLMWMLGGVQMSARWMRVSYPSAHRALGYAFLVLWACVVGPSAMFLSLCIRGESYLGTLASVTLLDVTCMAYYIFWRAWRVARLREQGSRSMQLHGNLMAMACLMTMAQLPQRLIQLVLIVRRSPLTP